MNNPPKISIYATVYNNGAVVENSINSIIKQFKSFRYDFEFVIVDNFSTDGTYEILQKFVKKYKNFKVIQMKCTKGVGRTVAYRNTIGAYTFYVDLDTIYLPGFSRLVYKILSKYKTNSIFPFGFMDRKTADSVIPWKDMNTYEDLEFSARAVKNGLKVFLLPITISKNYIITGNRDRRYAKGKIKLLKRLYRNTVYGIKGRGTANFEGIRERYTGLQRLFVYLVLIGMKLSRDEIFKYSDFRSNLEYLKRNEILLNPKDFGVDNRYWFYYIQSRFLDLETVNALLSKHLKMGFNKITLLRNGLILVYTDKIDKQLFDYLLKFYQNY